jgi:hypothetical protein
MSEAEVIKNATWEVDRICKIALRSDDLTGLRDMADELEELQETCAEYFDKVLAHASTIMMKQLAAERNDV